MVFGLSGRRDNLQPPLAVEQLDRQKSNGDLDGALVLLLVILLVKLLVIQLGCQTKQISQSNALIVCSNLTHDQQHCSNCWRLQAPQEAATIPQHSSSNYSDRDMTRRVEWRVWLAFVEHTVGGSFEVAS